MDILNIDSLFIFLMLNTFMIRIVALDVYGTFLASDDADNEMPPRRGIEKFCDMCHETRVPIVTVSDSDLGDVKRDLRECFERHPKRRMSLDRFYDFFEMNKDGPKEFMSFLMYYKINAWQVLVIGDSQKRDIDGAARVGAHHLLVPEYKMRGGEEFNFATIDLRKFK